MGGVYTMVQHAGLNDVQWLKLRAKCQYLIYVTKHISVVLLMNLFKQTPPSDSCV